MLAHWCRFHPTLNHRWFLARRCCLPVRWISYLLYLIVWTWKIFTVLSGNMFRYLRTSFGNSGVESIWSFCKRTVNGRMNRAIWKLMMSFWWKTGEIRNNWPMGIIEEVFKSEDGLVRKVVVKTIRDGKPTLYTRPIHELVLLMEWILLITLIIVCKFSPMSLHIFDNHISLYFWIFDIITLDCLKALHFWIFDTIPLHFLLPFHCIFDFWYYITFWVIIFLLICSNLLYEHWICLIFCILWKC